MGKEILPAANVVLKQDTGAMKLLSQECLGIQEATRPMVPGASVPATPWVLHVRGTGCDYNFLWVKTGLTLA